MKYTIENMVGKIIHADCYEVLKQLGDKSVDLVLTDPPYGIGYDVAQNQISDSGRVSNSGRWKRYACYEWDNAPPDIEVITEMLRVSQNQIMWGGNYMRLPQSSCWLVWNKIQRGYMTDGEIAWTSANDKPIRIFDMSRADSYINKCDGKCHPTQKPVPLFKWCLELFTKPDDLVLDPFAGSGTTALACHALNRRFICIEQELEYVNIARNRLRDAQAQLSLFDQGENSTGGDSENSVQQMQAEI
jgi:DNA modification methylase